MTELIRHKTYGTTLADWIASVPGELSIDAVGLWQIVPAGRDGFGLNGDALVDYVRQNIHALLEAGAVPVMGSKGEHEWIAQHRYGVTNAEIADAIIMQWLSVPDDPLVLISECPWFARPDADHPLYIKMD